MSRLWQLGTPLIEGNTATFVWYGDQPPLLRGDFNNWSESNTPTWTPHRPAEEGENAQMTVWTCSLRFPEDAYIEYCLGPDSNRQSDPFNKRTTPNGMGATNHYFYMPAARPTPLTRKRRNVLQGSIIRQRLPTAGLLTGSRRRVYLYRPASVGPLPLLVVLDGNDYLRRARLANILDNLIHQNRIQPLAAAFVANAGRHHRLVEYAGNESTLLWLQQHLLPWAGEQLSLLDAGEHPGAHGILGASLGGLMALYAGLRLPHIFGRILSQSGAFRLGEQETVVMQLVQAGVPLPPHIWLDVGRYERLREVNRQLAALLRERGASFGYHEFNAGHNYPAWRDNLWRGLQALFPPVQKLR